MRSRRLLIVLAVVILTLSLAGALRRQPAAERSFTPAPSSVPAAAGGAEANVVAATLPADRRVRAKLGDTVDLRVTSDTPDTAKILQLGLSSPVGPLLPGTISFVADATGRFIVTLSVADRAIGEIDVRG